MPFPADWIEERLLAASSENRLAHAYLFTGSNIDDLLALFHRVAARLLKSRGPSHPDLHIIQPESKSRRLTIEQVRQLEHQLQLRARDGELKVAGIVAADRMCIGSAEAANAFLKTLEEPPAHTVIFLLSDRPEQLLPTIRSRCLVLPLESEAAVKPEAGDAGWMKNWWKLDGHAADQAYRRAGLLAAHWKTLREAAELKFKDQDEDDSRNAMLEAEFLLARDNSLRALIHYCWEQGKGGEGRLKAVGIVEGLEELRYALSRNLEQNLALERTFLMVGGLIHEDI
ncbi:MAG: hypothetical protein PHD76_00700 [Methylacidiphilales bacterium]|nr:hypothetical protein [Candidatus Methylacidiphilales bacterium]